MGRFSNTAPTLVVGPDGFRTTDRRREAMERCHEYGKGTVVARAALIEIGYINHHENIVSSVVPNRVGNPSSKASFRVDKRTREDIVRAIWLGHLAEGHCAWLEDCEDLDGNTVTGIHCVDCNRASDARRAEKLAKGHRTTQ